MNTDIIFNPQIIEHQGQPTHVVIPFKEYSELLEAIEDYLDLMEIEKIRQQIDSGEEELIPAHVVYALLDGHNPIKVWREFREISQTELAQRIGISKAFMSQIESGTRSGKKHLEKIATVLNVDVDDLLPSNNANNDE